MLTPFDVVYNKLIEQLASSNDFKVGNVITFDKQANPKKQSVQTADLPEVLLYVSDMTGNFTESSSSVKLAPQYRYMLSTGSYDVKVMNRLLFNVLKLNCDWLNVLGPLTWRDKQFVKNSRLVSAPTGESNPEMNRNIKGWASIVTIELEFYLNKVDFLQGLT